MASWDDFYALLKSFSVKAVLCLPLDQEEKYLLYITKLQPCSGCIGIHEVGKGAYVSPSVFREYTSSKLRKEGSKEGSPLPLGRGSLLYGVGPYRQGDGLDDFVGPFQFYDLQKRPGKALAFFKIHQEHSLKPETF